MELAIITAKQVVILYCLILAGFAGVKSGVIKPEAKKAFSNLLLYLAVPANSFLYLKGRPLRACQTAADVCVQCACDSGRTCDYDVMYLPDERKGTSDPAVCLYIFQCGIYGVPADRGAV